MKGSEIAQLLPPCSPMTPACLQKREAMILQLVRQGAYVLNWVPIVIDSPPYRATIYVMNDALMLGEAGDAFRIGVTAQLQQQIADELDAVLLTPKLVDDIQRQAQISIDPPVTLGGSPDMGSTAWMLKHHNAVEAKLAKLLSSMGISDIDTSDMLLSNIGKHWVNSKYVSTQGPVLDCSAAGKHKPFPGTYAAENYGWFVSSRFTGGAYPAGTTTVTAIPGLNIWQTPGLCHNYAHADYSQVVRLASRYVQLCMPMAVAGLGATGCLAGLPCTMPDGSPGISKCVDIYELADSDKSALVSHEGRIFMRYPRVAWGPSSAGTPNSFGVNIVAPPSTWSGAGATLPAGYNPPIQSVPPVAGPLPEPPAQAGMLGSSSWWLAAAGAAAGYFGYEWLKKTSPVSRRA